MQTIKQINVNWFSENIHTSVLLIWNVDFIGWLVVFFVIACILSVPSTCFPSIFSFIYVCKTRFSQQILSVLSNTYIKWNLCISVASHFFVRRNRLQTKFMSLCNYFIIVHSFPSRWCVCPVLYRTLTFKCCYVLSIPLSFLHTLVQNHSLSLVTSELLSFMSC